MSPIMDPAAPDLARARIERFVARFGEPYRRLAWYAALPLILTPELLGYLRTEFLRGSDGVGWIAEADLLLSDLCRPVGYEQYALDQGLRACLIAEMRERLGEGPMGEAARLLLRYVRHLCPGGAGLSRVELQAEQWSAMAYLEEQRGAAVRAITAALGDGLMPVATDAGRFGIAAGELARLVRLTDALAPNLAAHPELLEYAALVARLLRSPADLRAFGERLAAGGAAVPRRLVEGVAVPDLGGGAGLGPVIGAAGGDGQGDAMPPPSPRVSGDPSLDAQFLRLVDDPAPSPPARLELGRRMGRLGCDPRPGIIPAAWTPDPSAAFPLDLGRDFDWVMIPAGPFRPGSGRDDRLAYDDERGGTPVALSAFAIGRYPVSCGQFAAFTRGGGYGGGGAVPPPWWREVSEAAVEWWQGGNPGLEQALADPGWLDESKRKWKDWLARRGVEARRRPWFEGDPQYADWLLPNHPVIGVSWFEAMAFCRWLSSLPQARAQGWAVRLPREVEWERAARGSEGRRYPWGDEWCDQACNSGAAGLKCTTAVGLFPAASPEGLRDLAGNVWEWTLTRWGPRAGRPDYRWSADLDDGRDDPGGADLRICRGGSWYGEAKDAPRWCRGACRFRSDPYYWFVVLGFRVVRVSLAVSVF